MDLRDLDARLTMAIDLVIRCVDANPDDPDLLPQIASLRASLEAKAPEHVGHIRERFEGLVGFLGLIPSDNEGEACD